MKFYIDPIRKPAAALAIAAGVFFAGCDSTADPNANMGGAGAKIPEDPAVTAVIKNPPSEIPSPSAYGGGGGGGSPAIKAAMEKIGKGPQSLGSTIGAQLKGESPDWSVLQTSSKEFVAQASGLAGQKPPRGTPESWEKQVAEFVAAAKDLEKASEAKDKDAATTANTKIGQSCNSCHQEHRPMRPRGRGGPGGPPPGGPGAGPPPGGAGGEAEKASPK